MSDLQIAPITMQDEAAQAALRALNNADARETSFLTPERWRMLVDCAFAATCAGEAAALLIALDQNSDYDGGHFLWFRERLPRFVYVDRIVVAGSHRRGGLASRMYRDLFDRACAAGHERVVCEVNFDLPNPVSDAFHARMGFTEMARATVADGSKTVRYLMKPLSGGAP
jgi:hypothetical protein